MTTWKRNKLAALMACVGMLAMPAAPYAADDQAFNQMLGTMAGRDTGSGWFDYYVERLNQELAFKAGSDAFGAAGPGGPLTGFEGYVAGFRAPDTGSRWLNSYVDALNRLIQEKQRYE